MNFLKHFLDWGLNGNVWIWFHMLGGAVGARIGIEFFSATRVLIAILILTLLWEVFEFIFDGGFEGMIKIYGSLERWKYDSIGDIIGAMVMAMLVVL